MISQANFKLKSDDKEVIPETQSVRLPEEPADTRVEDWFKLMGQALNLDRLDLGNTDFSWNTENEKIEVLGQGLTLEQADDLTQDAVLAVFEQNGFEQDAYNLALGDEAQIYGFYKTGVACLVNIPIPASQILINCGLLDLEGLQKTAQENIVKTLFSEKYQRDVSTVYVDIIQSTPNHISGSVQFIEPDEEQPTPGNVGAFLAAKDENGEWALVFDGNGVIYCADIEPYDFPVEMVPQCYDEPSGQIIER